MKKFFITASVITIALLGGFLKQAHAETYWNHTSNAYKTDSVVADGSQWPAYYLGTVPSDITTTTVNFLPSTSLTHTTYSIGAFIVCPPGWFGGDLNSCRNYKGEYGFGNSQTANVPISMTFGNGGLSPGDEIWVETYGNNGGETNAGSGLYTDGSQNYGGCGNRWFGCTAYGIAWSEAVSGDSIPPPGPPAPLTHIGQYDFSSGVGGSPVSIVIASGSISHIDTLTIGMVPEYTWGFFFPFALGWNCSGGAGYESGSNILIGSGCANVRQLGGYNATTTMGATGTAYVWTGLDQDVSGNVYLSWGGAYGEAGAYGTNSYSGSTFGYCAGSFCTPQIGSANVPYVIVNGTSQPAPPSPTISFLYPTNGIVTPLFSNFVFSGANLTSTDEYELSLQYFIPQVTGQQARSITVSGAQLINYGAAIPFTPFTGQFGTSSYMVAQAELYDVTHFQIPESLDGFLVATSSAVFSVITASNNPANGTTTYLQTLPFGNASTGISVATTTTSNPYPLSSGFTVNTASSTYNCQKPSDWTDIGGDISFGLCSVSEFLFIPSANVQQYMSDGYTNFKGAFPFGLVFGIHDVLSNAVTSSTDNGTTPTLALTMPNFVPTIGGQSMVFITSSTLKNAVGQSNFNMIFALEDALMWIFICWLMYEIVTTKR